MHIVTIFSESDQRAVFGSGSKGVLPAEVPYMRMLLHNGAAGSRPSMPQTESWTCQMRTNNKSAQVYKPAASASEFNGSSDANSRIVLVGLGRC